MTSLALFGSKKSLMAVRSYLRMLSSWGWAAVLPAYESSGWDFAENAGWNGPHRALERGERKATLHRRTNGELARLVIASFDIPV